MHFAAGAVAGIVILIMSVTGVALTYEKQLLEWADRRAWSAPPGTGGADPRLAHHDDAVRDGVEGAGRDHCR